MFAGFVKKYGLLFLVLAGAAALRFSAIGWGFQFDRKLQYVSSVHDDERRELRAIGQMHPGAFDFNPDDAQREGPLHPYMVSAALLAGSQLGLVQLSSDENFYREHPLEMKKLFIAGRVVSVLFGILEVLLAYCIGKRFFSYGAGLLGAAFMAVLPLEVVQSTYFRSYTLANVLLLGALWATLTITRNTARARWAGRMGAALAGFAFSTRISMAPALLLLPMADMVYGVGVSEGLRAAAWRAIRYFFTSTLWWFLLGIVVTNPTLMTAPKDVWRGMTMQLGYGGSFTDIAARIKNLVPLLHSLALSATLPVVMLAGIGIIFAANSRTKRDVLWLAAAFAIPYGYMVFGSSYATIPRFTMPYMPFVALLAAYATTNLFSFVKSVTPHTHAAKICMALGVAGILAYPTLYGVAHAYSTREVHPLERLAGYIEKNATPETSIGITWKHAHFKDIDYRKYPRVLELGDGLNGLETQIPDYLILFPYTCCDFYDAPIPQEGYEPQLQRYGYTEVQRFRGDMPPVLGIPFSYRIDRLLEYEARVYKRSEQ